MERAVQRLRGARLAWDPRKIFSAISEQPSALLAPETVCGPVSCDLEHRVLAEHSAGALKRRSIAREQAAAPVRSDAAAPVRSDASAPVCSNAPAPLRLDAAASFRPEAAANDQSIDRRAAELAALYLPDDTQERRNAFCALYVRAAGEAPGAEDMDVLRAHLLFDGDAEKAATYLRAFVPLRDLGFPEDAISSALLIHDLDRERALDHITK